MSDTQATAEAATEERVRHTTGGRRDRMNEARRRHSYVPVKNGTEQNKAILTVRDECQHLALILEDKCDEGPSKEAAKKALMEAQFWAIHAISHR